MNTRTKIVSVAKLKGIIRRHRRQGRTIAFTNGCFDLLHAGHVAYLEQAKKPGRVLIIGLNSDASVRRIKGPKRPVNTLAQRAAVLAALACVDYVTVFGQETPYQLIRALRPDILVKGADWKGKEVVGSDIVKRVELIRYLPKFSTTKMIRSIKKSA